MAEVSRSDSPEVVAHLLTLLQLREKSEHIQFKIAEVTARLQHARLAPESAPAPSANNAEGHGESVLLTLKELDDMLAQPDLMTREELRERLQDLIHRLGKQ